MAISQKQLKKIFIDAVLSRATKQTPVIQQIKFLNETKDAKATKNYSRRVAFIQFREHQHALVALRVLNNNPEAFGPERRPIVEFSLDNIQLLKRRQKNLEDYARADREVLPRPTTSQSADTTHNNHDTNRSGRRKSACGNFSCGIAGKTSMDAV